MRIDDAIAALIPEQQDAYAFGLKVFFRALLSLTPASFMGIAVGESNQEAIAQSAIINKAELERIWQSYQGNISKPEYSVKAFLASLYALDTLDVNNPSAEWHWLSKVCHLLVHFAQKNNQPRIKETCLKCRLWLNPASPYHGLWQACLTLQAATLEEMHHNFTQYRDHQISLDSEQKEFQAIYRSLDFAYRKRQPITRSASKNPRVRSNKIKPRTESHRRDDGENGSDELYEVTIFEDDGNGAVDFNAARLDIGVPDFTIIHQQSLRDTDKYSAQQIARRTQAKFAHANRQEMFISTSLRHLNTPILQAIFSALWYDFEDPRSPSQKTACAYLLLSMYTGKSVKMLKEDIVSQAARLVKLAPKNKRYELIITLDITPLRTQEANLTQVMANHARQMHLPLPATLGAFLITGATPEDDTIQQAIKYIKDELNLPLLSLGRLESALYSLLIHDICTTQLASIITGRNQHRRADLWYSSHSEAEITDCYQRGITRLSAKYSAGSRHLKTFTPSHHAIGSQNCPDYPLVQQLCHHLHRHVETATDPRVQFNAYNLWLWHICLLLTSVRAVNGAPGFLNQFNLEVGLAWISDKESKDTTSSQRFVPVCPFLAEAIHRFVQYLRTFARRYGRLYPEVHQAIHKIMASQLPLLTYMDDRYRLEAMSPAHIHKKIEKHFRFKLDWTRHVGQRFLHKCQIDEALILAAFGHEMMGQESWQAHSSLSVGDIVSLKTPYEQLAVRLKLQQISEKL